MQAVQDENFQEEVGGKLPSTDGSAFIDSGTDFFVGIRLDKPSHSF